MHFFTGHLECLVASNTSVRNRILDNITLCMPKLLLVSIFFIPFCYMSPTTGLPNNQAPDSAASIMLLEKYAAAFNAHDIKTIMSLMTDDCIFQSSAGDEKTGHTYSGQHAVQTAFEEVFRSFPDAKWSDPHHFIAGNRGVSEWVFSGTKVGGEKIEVTGCDLFTLRDGKIFIKNSYRKNRVAQ